MSVRWKIGLLVGAMSSVFSSCWVPQVVEGVRPEIFDPAPTPPPEVARQSLTSKEVALATRMAELSQTAADVLMTHSFISRQRQAVANHVYYNVKQAQPQWRYQEGVYTYYDAQLGYQYTLNFLNAAGENPGFDLLGFASYGDEPLPAKQFPNVKDYQLKLSETRHGKSVVFQSQGRWPDQVPLQNDFSTPITGSGAEPSVNLGFENLKMTLSGQASVSAGFTGDLSFEAEIEGRSYSGFGRLDSAGYVDRVDIQYNGVTVLSIERQSDSTPRWQVIKAGQVLGSVA